MKKALTLLSYACLLSFTVAQAQKKVALQPQGKPVPYEKIKANTTGVEIPASKIYPKGFESTAEFSKNYEANGPYYYINPAAELFDKRDLTTKHFKCKDGSVTAIVSAGPVHYKKNGVWNTILNDLYPNTQFAGYGYANTHNRFQTFYGNSLQNGIRVITEQNEQLDLMQHAGVVYLDAAMNQIGSAGAMAGNVASVKNETLNYQNLYSGVSASIAHNSAGYELSYELANLNWLNIPANTAYVSFREGVKAPAGYHAYLDLENTVVEIKNDKEEILLKYKMPRFYEKQEVSDKGRLNGQYAIEEKDGLIYINVLVPTAWLTDANRNFPVVIDPVVTITPQNAFAWTFTVDDQSGCYGIAGDDQDDNLRVGFVDGFFFNNFDQCYAKYDISSIPANSCFINYSYCQWYQYNFTNAQAWNDNNLKFYFQAYDPISTDPVLQT